MSDLGRGNDRRAVQVQKAVLYDWLEMQYQAGHWSFHHPAVLPEMSLREAIAAITAHPGDIHD